MRMASCLGRLSTRRWAMVRFSRAVRCGNRLNAWKTMPILRRTASMSTSGSVTSIPPTKTFPEVGSSRRLMQRSRVDLPDPDGPMTQTTSPPSTRTSMPRRTSRRPKYLWRSWTSMAAAPAVWVLTLSPGLGRLGLEAADHVAERHRDEQVAQPGDEDGGHADVLVQGVAAELGQLPVLQGEAEQVDQRGVLGQQDQLIGQRRQDDPKGLGKHDRDHRPAS